VLLAPLIAFALSFESLVFVATLKTVLVGKFVPILKPLWCGYVWFNEVVNALYETVAESALTILLGFHSSHYFTFARL